MARPQPSQALQALSAIARAVTSTADATRLANSIAQHACEVLGCDRAAVYLCDRSAECVPEEDRRLALRAIEKQSPLVDRAGRQVAVPLIVADRLVGMLLAHRRTDTFEPSDMESWRVLGALVAGGLAATSSQERLAQAQTLASQLTRREREVLRLVSRGLTNPQIGRALEMRPATAKKHVEHILDKLGVADRTQAAVYASELGLAESK